MAVLYRVLRQVLRVALDLYFVDIQRVGELGVPERGPLIFAANHPNSIMDTVILGAQTDRQICYMARNGLFANPFSRFLFNQCGVIPIYRAQDDPAEVGRNSDSFSRAYEVLEGGGCIGIFPEGQNAPERHVRELKTGTARIALEAEGRNAYELGVEIIPVGLNFEARSRFMSSVLVRFGEPIRAAKYADLHHHDPRGAVRALTDEIQESLRSEAVHIDTHLTLQLVNDIHNIYGQRLQRDLFGDSVAASKKRSIKSFLMNQLRSSGELDKDLEDHFFIKQRIADAVEHFSARRPELVDRIRADVRRYKDHLNQIKLRAEFTERPEKSVSLRRESIKFTLYALCFAIPALWGLLHNVAPYAIARTAWDLTRDEAMRSIRAFGVGFVVFPVFYGLQAWGLSHLVDMVPWWPWLIVLYVLSLPPTGFFWLRYSRQLTRYRDRIIARTFFRSNRNLIWALQREREGLLRQFEHLKELFVQESGSKLAEHMARRDREA